MRLSPALLAAFLGLQAPLVAQTTPPCTGLCQQQVTCPGGGTTSVSGTIYAPNGTDPLPNVLVYVPNAAVDAFTAGVSCPVVGQAPTGSPLVGTQTGADGKFSITNMPVGANIPLVIVSGRWRRQVTLPGTTACVDTPVDKTLSRMPKNQSEGDIPKIAIATGSADQVECVLRKVGLDDAEFTNPSGTGRINVYQGSGSPGARVDTSTPSEDLLMGNSTTLNSYDVLMLPCEGNTYDAKRTSTQLANLIGFANAGGRVYSSHYSYVWMYHNAPFNSVANWIGSSGTLPDGTATVNTGFAEGQTLSDWLQIVGASTTPGQIAISTIKHDFNGVNSPTQSWLTLNSSGNPVMQFVFDAPVGQTGSQCGRVLFNEYHVENPTASPTNVAFPNECPATPMNAQEKLLEYSLFELTSTGGQATMTPASADFGSVPVYFNSAPKVFTWTNQSTFSASVTSVTATGDYSATASGCASVASQASCQISVTFKPTALGTRPGVLSVGTSSQTLTADLTGIGVPDLTVSPTSLDFGNLDVGASLSKTVTVTNAASAGVPMTALVTSGDYSVASACPSTVPAMSSCTLTVTFKPTASGTRPGTMGPADASNPAYGQMGVTLTGNGLDFTIAMNPASGTTIAGYSASTTSTVSPLAGFAAPVSLTCTTNAPGSNCSLSSSAITPASATTVKVTITTTSTYTVVGYGGMGSGLLLLFAVGSGWLLCVKRRQGSTLLRVSAGLVLLAACGLGITGCGGKAPAQNANPTSPGSYTYTVTATDGIITHSATYSLNVTVK